MVVFWRQIRYLIYPTMVLFQFIHHVSKRFVADRCTYIAAALTYTSLLALVPLLATGFSILAAFPVFETVSNRNWNCFSLGNCTFINGNN